MNEGENISLEELDYELPEALIAQRPSEKRDECRLLVYNRTNGEISHHIFHDIVRYLREGDILVLNDAKVIKARLFFRKAETGAEIEVLLLRQIDENRWISLTRPAKRLKIGTELKHESGVLCARVIAVLEGGERLLELNYDGDLLRILEDIGEIPLPPYIKRKGIESDFNDDEYYQTVFAKNLCAIAAPTAGLHFTESLINELMKNGVSVKTITLRVGYGTFKPITTDNIRNHRMEQEDYFIPRKTATDINKGIATGRRIVACGTTVVRALEDSYYKSGKVKYGWSTADLFIYPGFKFKVTDALITNFHLPRSSLMAMVSAYVGLDRLKEIYRIAIEEGYRFFSYGDAMMIK